MILRKGVLHEVKMKDFCIEENQILPILQISTKMSLIFELNIKNDADPFRCCARVCTIEGIVSKKIYHREIFC